MNKKQKYLVARFIIVLFFTAAAIILMFDIRAWVNYSEARKAMNQLGQVVVEYRKEHHCVPPESYIKDIKERLEGGARLGNFHYRARWIEFDSPSDEILAYSRIEYPSLFVDKGFIMLELGGEIKWVGLKKGREILLRQQSPLELKENIEVR
jgi:hypothetical protein